MRTILAVVLSILLIATVIFAIKASSEGDILLGLEDKANNLELANQELKVSLVTDTSLSQVSKEAQTMGMVQPNRFVYIDGNGVAMRGPNQVASIQ